MSDMETQHLFDTNVQQVKYLVLREVIRRAYEGGLENAYTIPRTIAPGPKPDMRCCVHKERAVLMDRVNLAMGGNKHNPNVVEVLYEACDECPTSGMLVTSACRGCLLHACKDVCPKDAITIENHHAVIDKTKCIECGKCSKACPYSAIIAQQRPCIKSCKVKAISINDEDKAVIDNDKCIACGACIYRCPFGAISDKSLVLDIIKMLKESEDNTRYKVYAVVAPAIVSQCRFGRITQVVTAIRKLGFYKVVEAALGADITLYHEAKEWKEKGLLTTSCCPSFVKFVEKQYPTLAKHISSSVSPMIYAARLIKHADPDAKVVFIGPCASKKMEYTLEKTGGMIDSVMSFEELQAFVDARGIDTTQCEDTEMDNASYYGRIFAMSGGVAQGVAAVAEQMGIEGVKPCVMNGIDECRSKLALLKAGKAVENFFEGMSCEGGCVNGPLCITHSPRNVVDVEKYGNEAREKTIDKAVEMYERTVGDNTHAEG
ncbi:MAG: 4Fe-4S dicluster domain-containing protein [Bacteroidales bacterium]|nr:4Fe-4S dicluster domain-containing protein [Bacteroidales bacterium]